MSGAGTDGTDHYEEETSFLNERSDSDNQRPKKKDKSWKWCKSSTFRPSSVAQTSNAPVFQWNFAEN